MKYLDIETAEKEAGKDLGSGIMVDDGNRDHRLTLYIKGKRTTIRLENPLFALWVFACDGKHMIGDNRSIDEQQYHAALEDFLQRQIDAMPERNLSLYGTNQRLVKALIYSNIEDSVINRGQGAL